jgi:sucrose-6-phosphate hydrolase SacC (GH32 family)
VVPCAVAEHDGEVRLYYAGYERASDVRFRAYSGLAISTDGGETFDRYAREPVLPPNEGEQLFRAVHSIRFEHGHWRAWYGAGSRFVPGATKTLPVYDIRYFESDDGIRFPEQGTVCIPLHEGEHRVGRPYVVERGGRYEMFFGAGTEALGYRLGYARSSDGVHWTRRDELMGLTVSATGWDSEMIGYPAVVGTASGTYLFYTGNGYGRDGFGFAVLKAPSTVPIT